MSGLKAVMDLEQQFVTAFESLRSVLAGAGAELGDVVELVSYQVEIRRHMSAFVKVKDRYIGEPYPAWTAVGVSELIVPSSLVELHAVATLHEGR